MTATLEVGNMISPDPEVRYHLNACDEIVFVNEAWEQHAQINGGAEIIVDKILGRKLWDFISDLPTRQLYQQIIDRVRLGCHARFPLRCDTPWCKVLLEVNIRRLDGGLVEFATTVSNMELRPSVRLLTGPSHGCEEVLRSCAWCCRIDAGTGNWTHVEQATCDLKIFESSAIPQLSHGICPDCFESMTAAIDGMHPGSPAARQDPSESWKTPDWMG